MYLRIDGPHEQALLRLTDFYGEKVVSSVLRRLIHDAALKEGLWTPIVEPQNHVENETIPSSARG